MRELRLWFIENNIVKQKADASLHQPFLFCIQIVIFAWIITSLRY